MNDYSWVDTTAVPSIGVDPLANVEGAAYRNSMSALSDTAVAIIAAISNWLLIVGAVSALAGTGASIWANGEQQKRSNARIEASRNEAARATAETADIQRRLAPRTIPASARSRMVELLRKYSGQKYELGTDDEREARDLRLQLSAVLDEAGWLRVPPTGGTQTGEGDANIFDHIGIEIVVATSRAEAKAALAHAFVEALSVAGLAASARAHAEFDARPDVVAVIIGRKHTDMTD